MRHTTATWLFFLVLYCASIFAQTTYPLVCSGVDPNSSGYYVEVIAIGRVRRYEYHFHKGDRSYTAYLQSGGMPASTCTWTDRGLNAAEPGLLGFGSPAANYFQATGTPQNDYYVASNGAVENAIISLGNNIPYRHLTTFNVYSVGDELRVVSVA